MNAIKQVYGYVDGRFGTGLVRNIGCVFIVDFLGRTGKRDERIGHLPQEILDDLVEVLHEDAGARLLENLQFDESICGAVRHHHDPRRDGGGARLAWLLAATDLVVRTLGLAGDEAEPDLQLSSLGPFQTLDLGDLGIARILVDLEDRSNEIMVALDCS